jgi:lipoic acid synthetase
MAGLGESSKEVEQTLNDLFISGCRVVTIGQYLSPSSKHTPVIEYINPKIFDEYKTIAQSIGFTHVESGPLVRSSYMADKALQV